MPSYHIPGRATLELEHLVLDYNGTLAVDGILQPGTPLLLKSLSRNLHVHVVTADTFGKAREQLESISEHLSLKILGSERQDHQKADYVKKLGALKTAAIGNGANDALMLKSAIVGVAVIEEEGAASKSLFSADVVCRDSKSALNLFVHPKRLAATLRT